MTPDQPAPGLPVWRNEHARRTYMDMRMQIVALLIDDEIRRASKLRRTYLLHHKVAELHRTSNRIRKLHCQEN